MESDSGFESGHIFVSGPGSTCSARNKAVAVSKAQSEDDRRIEKAILYLDEKVRVCVCTHLLTVWVFVYVYMYVMVFSVFVCATRDDWLR